MNRVGPLPRFLALEQHAFRLTHGIDRVPPLSVYIAPSSDPLILQTFPRAIPRAPADTGVLVVLDWSKPQSMVRFRQCDTGLNPLTRAPQLEELLRWLTWLESWTTANTTPDERAAGRDRRESAGRTALPDSKLTRRSEIHPSALRRYTSRPVHARHCSPARPGNPDPQRVSPAFPAHSHAHTTVDPASPSRSSSPTPTPSAPSVTG